MHHHSITHHHGRQYLISPCRNHQTWNAAAATANPTAMVNSKPKEPAPPVCCAPVADAVADEVVETIVEADASLVLAEAEALPVSRGPSQCQWSPCGSHPTDSVGIGTVGVAVLSSSSWSCECDVVMEPVAAGPSQCQWSLCGSHLTDAVGLGARVTVVAPLTGPSQCLYAVSFTRLIGSVRSCHTSGRHVARSQQRL